MSPSPLPAGLRARPAGLDDVDLITAVMAASARAAVGEDDVTADDVRSDLQRPELDPEQDTFLVFDQSGRAVGYAEAVDEHLQRAFVDVYLDPALPDDLFHDLGRHLADRCIDRCEELVCSGGRRDVTVTTGCYRQETRLAAVLTEAGMKQVRVWWRMAVDLRDGRSRPAELPAGVTLRQLQVATESDDTVLAHRLQMGAFRDHFGSVDEPYDAYWERSRRPAYFDPSLWWVAEVDGVPAGLVCGDNRKSDEGAGWVRTLGVLDEHRGRGIAKALLGHSFAQFRSLGMTTVQLAVDSENPTGATALYESVGMSPVTVIDSYSVVVPR